MKKDFGLKFIDLAVAFLVLAIVIVAVIIILKPITLIEKNRDARRMQDARDIATAVDLYLADGKDFKSLRGPFQSNDPTINDIDRQKIDGNGWIPLKFSSISTGSNLLNLPIDPLNNSYFSYSFDAANKDNTYEVNTRLEASENQILCKNDGGNNDSKYEIGTNLNILP